MAKLVHTYCGPGYIADVKSSCAKIAEGMNHFSRETTLVAKVEAKGPPVFLTDLPMLENRFQFARYLKSLKR